MNIQIDFNLEKLNSGSLERRKTMAKALIAIY